MTKFPCYKEVTTAEEVTFFKGQYGFEVMEYHVRRPPPSLLHKKYRSCRGCWSAALTEGCRGAGGCRRAGRPSPTT